MRYKILLIGLIFISSGCVGSSFVTRDVVEIANDPYSNEIEYLGITQRKNADRIGDDAFNYFLRSWKKNDSKEVLHQVYVKTYYVGGWKFYQRASFEGGIDAEFVEINREVESCSGYGFCSYSEIFGILVPDDYLKEHKDGLNVKAYAKSGDEIVISLSKNQIVAQLWNIENN